MAGPNPLTTNVGYVQAADVQSKIDKYAATMAGDWTSLPDGHVLLKMSAALPDILQEVGYAEMYGVTLRAPNEGEAACPFSTLIILQKFLRANENHITKTKEQLTAALKWRKEYQPLKVMNEVFDKSRFEGLGYVTGLEGVPGSPNQTDICVFNIYGAVKDMKRTFGDLDGFIRWRVALMELTLQRLHLADAKAVIPDYTHGADPHQAYQVHDYLSISFLRQPPEVKAASQKTIQLFQQNYPETMAKKYFVNVPMVMQWMFPVMKLFMAKDTIAKMEWMSYGSELHKHLGNSVPKGYGGSGPELSVSSETPKYDGAGLNTATKAGEPAAVIATAPAPAPASVPATTEIAASETAPAPAAADSAPEIKDLPLTSTVA